MRPHRIVVTATAATACALAVTAVTVIALNSPPDSSYARSSVPAQVLVVDAVDAPERIDTSLGMEPPHEIVDADGAPKLIAPRPAPERPPWAPDVSQSAPVLPEPEQAPTPSPTPPVHTPGPPTPTPTPTPTPVPTPGDTPPPEDIPDEGDLDSGTTDPAPPLMLPGAPEDTSSPSLLFELLPPSDAPTAD
ncbi:hypothetical protein [Microbacterium caowuchunii]|uniref:hypothetical protein n=1 Tax=Microbacterium caowuchunii TaxID=2614638 RepID=UPI0017826ADC|nr:hypothetical protein [Microbacterium caowuchunii]